MANTIQLRIRGAAAARERLLAVTPLLRAGIVKRALRAGAKVAYKVAYAETPQLPAPVYRNGRMIRRPGTLKRALRIRDSKDVNRTGNVGVFLNYKPLKPTVISTFKATTGRPSSENPDDPYYFRWVIFKTRRNITPRPALQIAGKTLPGPALKAFEESLVPDINKLNR